MNRVMIEAAGYENIRRAVDRAFSLFPLKAAGKKVLVKPNVLRASRANEGIVTHPAVLRAVVDKLEEMNPAGIVVGDNPGAVGYGANEASFEETGLMAASKGYYQNIGNDSRKVAFNSPFMETVSVSAAVLDADIIVSLPKFKTHGLTVMTGAIKNSYGVLPGAQKARFHQLAGTPARFHELIVDVFRIRIPDFFIVDAVVGMEGNGPASPDLRQIGRILASDNAVALDAVIATMMGMAPNRLPFLLKAAREGLGEIDLKEIDIIGDLQPIPDFKLPPLSGEAILKNQGLQDLLHSKTVARPHADPDLCTACETCITQCPVSALSMSGNLPQVDERRCITCFCCQEICPEKAMVLQ